MNKVLELMSSISIKKQDIEHINELRDIIKKNITLTQEEVVTSKKSLDSFLKSIDDKENIDQFLLNKINETTQKLDRQIEKLEKHMSGTMSVKDICDAINRIMKAHSLILMTRDYIYRLKEYIVLNNKDNTSNASN